MDLLYGVMDRPEYRVPGLCNQETSSPGAHGCPTRAGMTPAWPGVNPERKESHMSRPSPAGKSSKRGQHGDAIGGLPGQPNIIKSGSGGGAGAGGPKKIKGPGANAKVSGKVKGM